MRIFLAAWLAISLVALVALPAAARSDVQVKGQVEIGLGDFDIVIGDLGDRAPSWNDSATRVHVTVLDGRRTRDHYFDSLPAALFVLREMYGAPRIVAVDVPDYLGRGLIDGTQAYYVLDYEQYCRGGMPLVLAFGSYRDALSELQYRNGVLMGFDDVVLALDRWSNSDRDRIYWRGWHKDRWSDNDRWNNAWNSRWNGWGWDRDRGWLNINVDLGNNKRDRDRDRDRNRNHRERYDRNPYDKGHGDRAHGNGYDRDRNRNNDGKGRDRDDRARGDGRERDRGDGDRGRGDRERGDGKDRGKDNGDRVRGDGRDGGNDNQGPGDRGRGEGKDRGKDQGDRVRGDGHGRDGGNDNQGPGAGKDRVKDKGDKGDKGKVEKGKDDKGKAPPNRQSGRVR